MGSPPPALGYWYRWSRATSPGDQGGTITWWSLVFRTVLSDAARVPGVVRVASSKLSPDMLHEEARIIVRAWRGDRTAFADLVERYWQRLFRWLFHLTHNRHTAEDLAQETFLKAFANLARFRSGSNFHAWLFRIGYNSFVNQWRGDERARRRGKYREADQIRDEVARLVRDVGLLRERIHKLQNHFNQASEDIRLAVVSIGKIETHGERIQQVELQAETAQAAPSVPTLKLQAGE